MEKKYIIHTIVLTLLLVFGIAVYFLLNPKTDVSPTLPVISDSKVIGNPAPIDNDLKKLGTKMPPKTQEKASKDSVFNQDELDTLSDLVFDRSPDSWKDLSYTKIEDNEDFREFLNKFHQTSSEITLSQSQKQNLVESLENLCFAFNKGSFSHFLKYRVPAEYKIRQRATDWQKNFLVYRTGIEIKDIPQDPCEIWKLYWEGKNASEWGFEGLWQDIAVPQITIKKSSTPPLTLFDLQELLDRPAALFKGSVDFKRKTSDVIREEGKLVYADIKITIRHITGLTYPMIVRSFWDSKIEKWLPYEMVICYTGRGRKCDPDF